MFRLLVFLGLLLFLQPSQAINPDFYVQKKKKEVLKRKRERGAASKTKARKAFVKVKEKRATAYTPVRRRQIRARAKREKLFDKDLAQKIKFKNRKVAQASRYAKKRRKKEDVHWKEENLEYGIRYPVVKKKK